MLFAVDGFAVTPADAHEAAGGPIARPAARARGARPPAQRCARWRRRGLGGAWRARRGEDCAARVDGRGGAVVPGPTRGRGRGGDGTPVRRASTAVLAGPRPIGASAGS